MMTLSPDNLTDLLREWRDGDKAALDKLTPLVYDELRRIAHRYVRRERNGHTLQTTALVLLRRNGASNASCFDRLCAETKVCKTRRRGRSGTARGGICNVSRTGRGTRNP